MMDKRLTVIYADAAEKFVKNVVLYGYEGRLYYDEACTETELVNGAELENLFLKGLVIYNISDNAYEVPVYCDEGLREIRLNTSNNQYVNQFVEEAEAEEEAE